MAPQDRALALINLQAQLNQQASETGSARWNEQQQSWQTEIQNDPELGGDKLPTTVANIARVMDRFATPEVRDILNQTGLGNNPHLVRFMNAVGKQFAEGGVVPGGRPSSSATSLEKRLYPNLN